jgi:elongator complex protein 1
LVEGTIHPGLDEAHELLTELFEEMGGQLDKEMKRLADLRRIWDDDPGQYRC